MTPIPRSLTHLEVQTLIIRQNVLRTAQSYHHANAKNTLDSDHSINDIKKTAEEMEVWVWRGINK